MSDNRTPGSLIAGVSSYQGIDHFTAVAKSNSQKIVALCGVAGANDETESIDNVRRLVACWNACQSIETGYLERYGLPDFAQKISDLIEQRENLLAALTLCREMVGHPDNIALIDAAIKQHETMLTNNQNSL